MMKEIAKPPFQGRLLSVEDIDRKFESYREGCFESEGLEEWE
ncbi:hypothetical protein LEP1GSC196_2255 [Leptospira meyeri serovar Semaranga str. Veldrot Semarang 173]|nr:hypothetical protein LEP1GSC196_2255 [Leptospira meyeri serovar Semaranga str. Veldrot Semarang 173]